MIKIEKKDETCLLMSFDGREELAEAMDMLMKEFPRIGNPIHLTYLPPKTLEDLAKIDIYPQKGYLGVRR